jgi:predicted RNA polymerase sigma factor
LRRLGERGRAPMRPPDARANAGFGRITEAGAAYRRALALVHDDAERRLLGRRVAELPG